MKRSVMMLMLLVLGVCGGTAAAAAAKESAVWRGVTLVVADGSTVGPGDLAWHLDGMLLRLFTADGKAATYDPLDVTAVRAADGRDITQEVADASPTADSFALLGRHRTRPLHLGVLPDVGGSLGFDQGWGGMRVAAGFSAGVRLGLGERSHLRLQYRRQQIRERAAGFSTPLDTWSDEFAALVGMRLTHPRRNDNYAYLEAGPVLVMWRERPINSVLVSSDDSTVGALLRGGVILPVGENLSVDVGAFLSTRSRLDPEGGSTAVTGGVNLAVGFP